MARVACSVSGWQVPGVSGSDERFQPCGLRSPKAGSGEPAQAWRPGPTSIQEIGAVQRVALFGNEAGVADDAPQLFFAGVVMCAGGGDHVLLDHDAAHVVAAEAQADLAGLQSLGDPGRLNVLDVVEVDARDRQVLQIFYSGGLFMHEAAE